jgi:hypothetical protein
VLSFWLLSKLSGKCWVMVIIFYARLRNCA